MTPGELLLVMLGVLMVLCVVALVVVLIRVLDALRDLRRDVVDLRDETRPLLSELRTTTDEARSTVVEARGDLERFDKVLGSAEAIGDAVGGRVAKTAFSSPAIKAAGLAKGTSRAWSRLRGDATPRAGRASDANVIDVRNRSNELPKERRRRRA